MPCLPTSMEPFLPHVAVLGHMLCGLLALNVEFRASLDQLLVRMSLSGISFICCSERFPLSAPSSPAPCTTTSRTLSKLRFGTS